eukprot:GHVQ01007578.1.p1 GENE.GHVQ01007578.1~~GHVQ01007578.1.p1  ORF type:complete len:285 (-),score=34.83 GHVQ01007578.1:408-1262(-)
MANVVRPSFKTLDVDGNGKLDKEELRNLLIMLNEKPTEADIHELFLRVDTDASGYVEFEEFVNCLVYFVLTKPDYSEDICQQDSGGSPQSLQSRIAVTEGAGSEVEEDDEEIPEDLAGLPANEQQRRIKLRALRMCVVGTVLVLVFSDPIVNVFSNIGKRTGIPAFYVSFVLAPLASNASEILASYNYSLKKTHKSITISFSALEGAATMNNTLGLGIFLSLVFFQNLMWTFAAETISVIIVQIIMGLMSQRKVHRVVDGFMALALYPLALLIVWSLENIWHFD